MRLRLETIDGATGKRRTKWAYAPFLAVTDCAWAPKVSFISFVILETILRVVHQFISVAFRDSPLNSYDITACAGEGSDEGGNEVVVGGGYAT